MKKVLVVEPYFGGSHKQFLNGLAQTVDADFTFLTLPARKWKMRMQLSAPWFVSQIDALDSQSFDVVLCSTFVDVAVLRSLLTSLEGWSRANEFCTYFHENQFIYPGQAEDSSRFQFSSINFNTALASDRIAFNSHFNRETFLHCCTHIIKKAADINLQQAVRQIEAKSVVIHPGIDFGEFRSVVRRNNNKVPVLCWNHRWEHDKNPQDFFNTLEILDQSGVEFKLIVLGQSFKNVPAIFAWAKDRFRKNTIHFGYVESRKEYVALLHRCDIVISTSTHEFFGISIIEAIRAGCYPLLPDRLSYPELYPEKYRYVDGQLPKRLGQLIKSFKQGDLDKCDIETERYSWQALKKSYEKWLFNGSQRAAE